MSDRTENGHQFKWFQTPGFWYCHERNAVLVFPPSVASGYWIVILLATGQEQEFDGDKAEERAFNLAATLLNQKKKSGRDNRVSNLTDDDWKQLLALNLTTSQRELVEVYRRNGNTPIGKETLVVEKKLPISLFWGMMNDSLPKSYRLGKADGEDDMFQLFKITG